MKVRRRFLIALMASLALHLGMLTAPGWRVALLDDLLQPEAAATLEARLAPAARPAKPAAPARQARRQPAPRAAAETESAAAPAAAVPEPEPVLAEPAAAVPPALTLPAEPEAERPAGLPAAPGAATAAEAEIALPRQARIRFVVTRGADFIVGTAVHEWRRDGDRYAVRNVAETVGLAALFRPAKIVQNSEGGIAAGGLRPREFTTEKNGAAGDWARFDWQAGKVALAAGPREALVDPGSQDMLSMFYQLALLPLPEGATVSVPVATGKKVERHDFVVVGAERLSLAFGERQALHLRTQGRGGDATEVWLSLEGPRLPLKIRHIDRKGEVFDQVAEYIESDGITEGTR